MKKNIQVKTRNSEEEIVSIKSAIVLENKISYIDNGKVEIEKTEDGIIVNRTINDEEKIVIIFNECPSCKYINNSLELNLNIKVNKAIYNNDEIVLDYVLEGNEHIEIIINIGGNYDN